MEPRSFSTSVSLSPLIPIESMSAIYVGSLPSLTSAPTPLSAVDARTRRRLVGGGVKVKSSEICLVTLDDGCKLLFVEGKMARKGNDEKGEGEGREEGGEWKNSWTVERVEV